LQSGLDSPAVLVSIKNTLVQYDNMRYDGLYIYVRPKTLTNRKKASLICRMKLNKRRVMEKLKTTRILAVNVSIPNLTVARLHGVVPNAATTNPERATVYEY